MARYKALKSFCGIIGMRKNAEREINDDAIAQDLLRAGLIIAIDSPKAEKKAEAKPEKESSVEAVEIPAKKKAGRKPKSKDGES